MKTVTVNTSELEGAALDWAVAKSVGRVWLNLNGEFGAATGWLYALPTKFGDTVWSKIKNYSPSTSWAQGGPLLEEWRVALIPEHSAGWTAQCYGGPVEDSDTPQGTGIGFTAAEALCKSIIDAVLGETVEIPEELMG